MKSRRLTAFILVLISGLIPAIICQFFVAKPSSRNIHVRNFRYGKEPSVIRCNRGDTLHITFSSEDTGHSFFLQEFNVDAKVTPLKDETEIFRTDDPTVPPTISRELTLVARHAGIMNYLVSKSNYRCHVWCGPMHAFESGKLVIFPNTLLIFSLGCLAGISLLWFIGLRTVKKIHPQPHGTDLFLKYPILEQMARSRWPQIILTVLTLLLIYVVLMTTLFGTKVSGRNLGVLLMWAVWLFLLVSIITPLGGRAWCTICPLPMIGDFLQRRSFFTPETGKTGMYNNHFSGLFLKWPTWLSNNWLRLFVFLVLATFSTTLVASPKVSGFAVLGLILVPTIMASIWEHRAFCRFVCPISVFITPFSELSPVGLRSRSGETCSRCRPKFCQNGNNSGWACPYGLNTGELKDNNECGLCLECVRSCTFKNVTFVTKPAGAGKASKSMSEAWLAIAIFTTSIVYSFLYLGHWPVLRDYVNIIDKDNWGLFGVYASGFFALSLFLVPGLLYLLAVTGKKFYGEGVSARSLFLEYSSAVLPLGLTLWIAFVIPMLFVNVTFIAQSLSDPFGWGWDFFGTANIPWKQFIPQYIPWLQAILVLTGLFLSLGSIHAGDPGTMQNNHKIKFRSVPIALFLIAVSCGMIVFFTN